MKTLKFDDLIEATRTPMNKNRIYGTEANASLHTRRDMHILSVHVSWGGGVAPGSTDKDATKAKKRGAPNDFVPIT